MTSELALKLGRAVAHIFKERHGRGRIVVGKDTRLSGYMLETAIASGICSMGLDVWIVGPLPTPGIAFITRSMRADAGIVISASHNPYQDNGIKIFSGDGFKLPDELEIEMEGLILDGALDTLRPVADEIGKAHRIDDAIGRYIVFLKHIFPQAYSLDGLRLVVDCANGAAYKVAPSVFEELGAHVVPFGVEPDGANINRECGALYPERLRDEVVASGAQLGIAFDGDADRVIFIDEKGTIVDGDAVMAILGVNMKSKGRLQKNTVVSTIASNMGLEVSLREQGIDLVRTNVGDRYVLEAMLRDGYNFGGEKSGHVVCLDHNTTGDGIVTALMMLKVIIEKEQSLSDLKSIFREFPQVEQNVRVKEKKPIDTCPALHHIVAKISGALGNEGRVVVRYSGTEMLLRVMVEGNDEATVKTYAQEIADTAKKELSEG